MDAMLRTFGVAAALAACASAVYFSPITAFSAMSARRVSAPILSVPPSSLM
jgi:hypothetical protein